MLKDSQKSKIAYPRKTVEENGRLVDKNAGMVDENGRLVGKKEQVVETTCGSHEKTSKDN